MMHVRRVSSEHQHPVMVCSKEHGEEKYYTLCVYISMHLHRAIIDHTLHVNLLQKQSKTRLLCVLCTI